MPNVRQRRGRTEFDAQHPESGRQDQLIKHKHQRPAEIATIGLLGLPLLLLFQATLVSQRCSFHKAIRKETQHPSAAA